MEASSQSQWFMESYNGSALMIKIKETIFESDGIQKIQIFNTEDFGRMLVLDGKIQLTERDEQMYHEMLVHVPLFMVENPKKILIIGGGDGGAVREALKHNPDEVVMVEIDRDVVEACKKFIGIDRGALNDARVTVLFEDGIEFVRNSKEKFDVVIVDGTDPNPVSQSLVAGDFYISASKITKHFFVTQSQSPFVQQEYFTEILRNARKGFDFTKVYINFIPTYPLGLWSYTIASKEQFRVKNEKILRRWNERMIETFHYNPEIHIASFSLPNWLKEIINSIKD